MEIMIEHIETERCVLRKVSIEDAQAIFVSYAQDDEIVQYLSWSTHQSIDDTIAFMYRCIDRWGIWEAYTYVIIHKESNMLIGSFDFRPMDTWASFGYVLAKNRWGKWYMTEVLSAMIEIWFSDFWFTKIIGYCDTENIASVKVMEKSGMQFVGIKKWHLILPFYNNEKRDAKVYEITNTY